MNLRRVRAIAANDLRQLAKSRDYWAPLLFLAGLFFVALPLILLTAVTRTTANELVVQLGGVLGSLPERVQANIAGTTPQAQAAYSLAVFLLAPIAVVVPLTISSAVGANAIVGERERGTGEFLAHSPASEQEIYLGKLVASLLPGYAATFIGFGLYALVVNLVVGPLLGGWFFPTAGWWVLILWVVPPFLAVALTVILRISARVRSAAAAQQASQLVSLPVILISYGVAGGFVYDATIAALVVGTLAWLGAALGLATSVNAVRRERLLGVESGKRR